MYVTEMPKTRSTGYQSLNVRPETLEGVRRYAGKIQVKTGKPVTDDVAVKSLLKRVGAKKTE